MNRAAAPLVPGLGGPRRPTDLIDTPLFGREVPPTWWSWPALLARAVLAGLLFATYVREPGADADSAGDTDQRSRVWGGAGGLLTFFAVGCPVCNKLVLLALALLGWALARRLADQTACTVSAAGPPRSR